MKVTSSEVEIWLLNPVTQCYFKAVESEKAQLSQMNIESTEGLTNEVLINQLRKWSGYDAALTFILRKIDLLAKYGYIAAEIDDNDNANKPAE